MTQKHLDEHLAEFASDLQLENVAPSAVEKSKGLVIDAIGCALAGDLSDEMPAIRAAAGELFGEGQFTAIGSETGLSSAGATFVNAYSITAMTVCDVYRPAHCHMTPLVVPPSICVAEEIGASGRDLLTAVIVGMETMARIALGLNYEAFRSRGWHSPGVIGPMGAAAAVGRLQRFSPEMTLHALGLAATQSAGSYLSWGTPAVKFHQARGALSGLLAARLAAEGFIGGTRPLTDPDGGIYNTHSDGGDIDAALTELGDRWELEQIAIRLWPGASPVQSMITAVFDIIGEEDVSADSVYEVEIGISVEDFGTHGGFSRPNGTFEALLSYAYLCATALHERQLWFDQVRPPAITDPRLLDYGEQRVTVVPLDDVPVDGCELTMLLGDGHRITKRVETARGTPQNPASRADVEEKFRKAVAGRLDAADADKVLELLWNLEDQDRLTDLWRLLRAS